MTYLVTLLYLSVESNYYLIKIVINIIDVIVQTLIKDQFNVSRYLINHIFVFSDKSNTQYMIGRIYDNYYNTYYKNVLFGNLFLLHQIQY